MVQKHQGKMQRLEKRRDQLVARIQAADNRRIRNESQKDTRRKIIIGRFFQRKHAMDGTISELITSLDPFLVRPNDRLLFGLDTQSPLESIDDLPLRGVILIGAYYLGWYRDKGKEDKLVEKLLPVLRCRMDCRLFGLIE